MNHQRFALLVLILSFGLGCFSIAACGDDDDDGGNLPDGGSVLPPSHEVDGKAGSKAPPTRDSGTPDETPDETPDAGVMDPAIDLSCVKLRQLRGYTVSPSAIAQLFTVETCADGIPVPGLETGDFDIAEDGTKLSSEAAAEFQKSTGLRVYVSLVLDMSSSTRMALPFLIEGAQNFVNELLVKRKLKNVLIGIDVFDGSPTLTKWLLPISDATRLNDRIAQLATDYVNQDASSTNLNGAARDAVTQLQQRQIQVMNANDNGVVTVGYAVLFTDGADTAGRVTDDEAIRTLAAARYVNPSNNQVQATVATYAVPLAGPDYTPGSLEKLLSGTAGGQGSSPTGGLCSNACQSAYNDSCDDGRPGSDSSLCSPGTDCADCGDAVATPTPGAGCADTCAFARSGSCDDGGSGATSSRCLLGTDCSDCGTRGTTTDSKPSSQPSEVISGDRFVFQADSASALKQRFADLAAAISRQLDGTYLLAYCSPKRQGEYTLSINVKKSVSPDSTGYEFPFSAAGFGPGCSTEYFRNVCADKTCGGFNCGACDEETEVCNAAMDKCESGCVGKDACNDQTFTNAFGYAQVCDADPDFKQCGGSCLNTSNSPQHCGDCNHACASAATCVDGECECPTAGQTSCPNGCFDLQTDESNCGVCGNYCPDGISCVAGKCDCGGGELGCYGVCLNPATSQTSCGACGHQCPGDATCTDSECVCTNTALTACGTSCVDTKTSAVHCGACDSPCDAQETCVDGACASCVDATMPAGTTATYNGAATAPRDITNGTCGTLSDAAKGVAIAWTAPMTGYYNVMLTSTGELSGYVRSGGCTGSVQTCLTAGDSTSMNAAAGAKYVFYVGSMDATASAFTLSITMQ